MLYFPTSLKQEEARRKKIYRREVIYKIYHEVEEGKTIMKGQLFLLANPTNYPWGVKPAPGYEYAEVAVHCEECQVKALGWNCVSLKICSRIPEGWEEVTGPILAGPGWGNGWYVLVRRPIKEEGENVNVGYSIFY